MRKVLFVLPLLASLVGAQNLQSPVLDTRLSIHTLVREDIFAGFISGDMTRLARGEKTLERLLVERPGEKAGIYAWQAGAVIAHSLDALDHKRPEEFEREYQRGVNLLSEALKIAPQSADPGAAIGGVTATSGGTYLVFADRLPEKYRAQAWTRSYELYRSLYKMQEPVVAQLPLHLKGELLAGLAVTAQRTGHSDEAAAQVDKIIAMMPGTLYEKAAKGWKEHPETMATTTIACQTCHESGRLAASTARLKASN